MAGSHAFRCIFNVFFFSREGVACPRNALTACSRPTFVAVSQTLLAVLRERRLRAANDANPSDGCRWMVTAFSPRKQAITLYGSSEFKGRHAAEAVGKHSCGGGCVFVKRLSGVHLPTLKKLVKASVRHTKKNG